ncbi:response regulator transcription factor [Paenibacillus antibioticophila]|uniref:response regulator transcription factor n=1 Tax=Paenibacillus antibioticophila TaxID=1274374 RepID=UPI0005CB5CED|nr:response regulator [Paenibacillus antibioticophila]
MNVMIVDDELSAIEAVRNGIQWETLGIGKVYTATNVQDAIRQFQKRSIDILLSDIEMPMGSGLELLKWTNEHYPNVKCIFMTCHADFHFLQEAMQLGSVDYILKPLEFSKVELVLKKTMEKILTNRILKENSNSWIQNKETVIRQFWKDFFLGEISPNKESLMNYFRQKRLDIRLESYYLPILVVTKKWTEPVNKVDQKLLQYALRNIANEILVIPEIEREVLPFSEMSVLIMLRLDTELEEHRLNNIIEDCCRQLIAAASKYIKEIICCYVGIKDSIYEMPSSIEALQERDFNNVIHESEVFFLYQEQQFDTVIYSDNPIGEWREWLKQGRYEEILSDIRDRLTHTKKSIINRDFLNHFTRDFYYLIFEFANDRSIFVNELLGDPQSNLLLKNSLESLEGLLDWVSHTLNIMRNFDKTNANRSNPVERTKNYIQLHLSEEISMEHIANNVYLNADYLTRIFKKEVGVSISRYIINKKMEVAKELLIHTDKSIGDVAMLVGYYNYSSFNRIFTKEIGTSPQEFKNSNIKKSSTD